MTALRRWGRTLYLHRWSLPGIVVIVVVIAAWLFRSSLTSYSPSRVYPDRALLPPGTPGSPLGTDEYGRDVLARLLAGVPNSLLFGVTPAVVGMLLGLVVGLSAGVLGGLPSRVLMAIVDVLLSFPFILMAILLASTFGASMKVAIVAVTLAVLPTNARLIRSQALSIMQRDFVTAAELGGVGRVAMMWRHLLPNVLPTALIVTGTDIGIMITLTAGLSFLGLGVRPPDVDWGTLISEGAPFITSSPVLAFAPSVMVAVVGIAFASIADAERRRQRRYEEDS